MSRPFLPLLATGLLAAGILGAQAPVRRLDSFADLRPWQAAPSDGVRLRTAPGRGPGGPALTLRFDFQGRGGYAAVRRRLPLVLPDNYEFAFWVRGDGPPNNLEFKLVDESGENVWWSVRRDFAFPGRWTRVVVRRRQIAFAWGPSPAEARKVASLEFCVTAGKGGKGEVAISGLTLRPLPPDPTGPLAPRFTASSARAGAEAARLERGGSWHSAGPGGWLQADLGQPREFGGLRIAWDDAGPRRFQVRSSRDGRRWTLDHEVRDARGPFSWVALPDHEARYVRIACPEAPGGQGWGVRGLTFEPLAFGASPNALFTEIARTAPRGDYPRGFTGEQGYWTLVGVDGGEDSGLLGEDGTLELGRGGPSLEPFLLGPEGLLGWAQAEGAQSLEEGCLPIPTATRRMEGLTLAVTALATGPREAPVLRCRYRVARNAASRWKGSLCLALRPFQVNPPAQFLGLPGGVSNLRSLEAGPEGIRAEGRLRVASATRPDGFGTLAFDQGSLPDALRRGTLSGARVEDPAGFASGVLRFDLDLGPGEAKEVFVDLPLGKPAALPAFQESLDAARREWTEKLGRVRIELPDKVAENTLRTCLAHILISRRGPALQPGTRAYARSWIRDGALMAAGLLRLGHPEAVRDFAAWYAPHLFEDGKVPCVVDLRGADPVPEHDSHGEFLFLLGEYERFTGDRTLADGLWPQVRRVAGYLETTLARQRGPAFETGEARRYRGLMPPSISHEGYAAKPMHSYWDDFFTLLGLKNAAELAGRHGDADLAGRASALAATLRADLLASFAATRQDLGIDYLAGCADLGDFDPTSTTVGLAPGGELANLPRAAVEATFERFYREFRARRERNDPQDRYTPYETRLIGTFAQLGRPDRAQELLAFYLGDLRPAGWNQWPEVVQRDLRAPVFLGDLPHAWVASDYIRSLLSLLALERDGDVVVGGGLPEAWLRAPGGVNVAGLRLPGGRLDFRARAEGARVIVELDGPWDASKGALRVRWPLGGRFRSLRGQGDFQGNPEGTEVVIRSLPATVVMEP